MERPTCETCVHWCELHPHDNGLRQGKCRRFPPTEPIKISFDLFGRWLTTFGDMSCGEHDQFPRYLATIDAVRHARETMP